MSFDLNLSNSLSTLASPGVRTRKTCGRSSTQRFAITCQQYMIELTIQNSAVAYKQSTTRCNSVVKRTRPLRQPKQLVLLPHQLKFLYRVLLDSTCQPLEFSQLDSCHLLETALGFLQLHLLIKNSGYTLLRKKTPVTIVVRLAIGLKSVRNHPDITFMRSMSCTHEL